MVLKSQFPQSASSVYIKIANHCEKKIFNTLFNVDIVFYSNTVVASNNVLNLIEGGRYKLR